MGSYVRIRKVMQIVFRLPGDAKVKKCVYMFALAALPVKATLYNYSRTRHELIALPYDHTSVGIGIELSRPVYAWDPASETCI